MLKSNRPKLKTISTPVESSTTLRALWPKVEYSSLPPVHVIREILAFSYPDAFKVPENNIRVIDNSRINILILFITFFF